MSLCVDWTAGARARAGVAQGGAGPEHGSVRGTGQRNLALGQTAGEAGKPREDSKHPTKNARSNWRLERAWVEVVNELSKGEDGKSTEVGQSLGMGGEKFQRSVRKERQETCIGYCLIKLGAQKVAERWAFSQDSL